MVKINENEIPTQEQIERVRQFIGEHKPDLTIYRVPQKTLEVFKRLAKEEFANDYGMALKYLLDYAIQDAKFQELSQRLLRLEEKILTTQERTIKTLSGRVIKLKEGE